MLTAYFYLLFVEKNNLIESESEWQHGWLFIKKETHNAYERIAYIKEIRLQILVISALIGSIAMLNGFFYRFVRVKASEASDNAAGQQLLLRILLNPNVYAPTNCIS
jgi:hypothetical protein